MKAYVHRTAVSARVVSIVGVLGVMLGMAASARADLLHWQGGTDILYSANWYNDTSDTSNDTPVTATGDELRIGANGTVNFDGASGNFATTVVRVGHEINPDSMPLSGTGTLNQSGGIVTTNAFIHVGQFGNAGEYNLSNGTLNNNNDFFQLGFNFTGTVNQSGGTINTNLMNLGTDDLGSGRGDGTLVMTSGSVNVTGRPNPNGIAGALRVGRQGDGLFDMSSGDGVLTANVIFVSDFASSTGEMRVGDQSQVILNNNDRFMIGRGRNTTTGALSIGLLTMTGGSITLLTTLAGAGNVPTGNFADFVVGWDGVGQVDMSGGTITVGNSIVTAIAGASGPAPRSQATINHSGGTINAVRMILSERGETNYNLSGTGEVNLTENLSLGVFNPPSGVPSIATVTQTGGTMNVGNSVLIGEGNLGGTGVYEISDGVLDVGLDLVVGLFNGDGDLNVLGADGQIAVHNNYFQDPNGQLFVKPDSLGQLSTIDVAGDALFHAGTELIANFDDYPGYGPGQFWNVLTAANITDNGISLTAPAGVLYQIIGGGNGQILQLYVPIPEPASIMLVVLAGLTIAVLRRRAHR